MSEKPPTELVRQMETILKKYDGSPFKPLAITISAAAAVYVSPFFLVAGAATGGLVTYFIKKHISLLDAVKEQTHTLSAGELAAIAIQPEFLDVLGITVEAALKAPSEEKRLRFASMISARARGEIPFMPQYEEVIHAISQLSDREWSILNMLYRYQPQYLLSLPEHNWIADSNNLDNENLSEEEGTIESFVSDRHWKDFTKDVKNTFGLSRYQFKDVLTVLNSKGCVIEVGVYLDPAVVPPVFLSEFYYTLRSYVGHLPAA